MTESGSGSRRLDNWINAWLRYSEVFPSPEIFRKWTGIGIIAAACERKVWARTKGANLYPNLYTILVGPPGVGKSAALSPAERILRQVPELFVAPSSVTTASLIDTLEIAKRKIVHPQFVQFNSLAVVASELGVFLPAYDPAFMNTLQKMYDGETYEERRRTGKVNHVRIDSPQLNIIGGTTPSYLNSFLPDGAWDQGFTSRTVFIYSGESVRSAIFAEEEDHDRLENLYIDLVHDLKLIGAAFGKVSWSPEAAAAIVAWDHAGLPPVPEHGKLAHYNSRRLAHTIKLCIIASVARNGAGFEVALDDFQAAQNWLLEAESRIPDIFHSMGVSGDARAIEDTWYFVWKSFSKDKRPIGEHRVIAFLRDRVPSHNINKIIEIMVRSKMLRIELINGIVHYIPERKES